jgi:hypothetical protein
MLAVAAGLARWNHRRGVHVEPDGIRNVGASRASFTPWSEVRGFVIGPHTGGTVAVFLERTDGSREPLQYMVNLPFRRRLTEQFLRTLQALLDKRREGFIERAR